jgi:hypothetical protein
MSMAQDWTPQEIEWILEDYFRMLELEIRGEGYVKKAFRERLRGRLNNRSHGSVEFKHQNISAVLVKYGLPYISGYKPRFNYQHLLEEAVLDYLEQKPALDPIFMDFALQQPSLQPAAVDFGSLLVKAPELTPLSSLAKEPKQPAYTRRLVKPNYLELEQRNRFLGAQGEQLIVEYEQWRLHRAGKSNLADRVEWISKEQGDGAGFDILSRNENGTDRYIEVKTTKLGELTPIYVTRNELDFSRQYAEGYHVYRVFRFGTAPRFFAKQGAIDRICRLEAREWVGRW